MIISSLGHYEIHLRDYLYILRKRRGIFLIFLTLVVGMAFLYTMFDRVVYHATATILIEKENPNVLEFKEVMALDASSTDYYQTQYQMLRSVTLIEKLSAKEDLQHDPYLNSLKEGFLRKILNRQSFLSNWAKEFITEPAVEDLFIRKMLQINPLRNSRLVEVSVLHPDPKRSQELTNELIDLFIRRSIEDRFAISQQATGLISQQLIELKEKVAVAEKKLQEYKEKTGLVNIPSVREKNEFLQDAKLQLVELQAEESKLSKRYLPAHPKMIHLRSQIEGLEEKIKEEERRILELSRTAVDYSQYEREAKSSRQIYETLLGRLQETASEAQTQSSNIMIVDRAKAPSRPYRPRPMLNILTGLFIGFFGGIFLAFFSEYLDSTVKIPDDIEKGLGLELLGIIPRVANPQNLFLDNDQNVPAAESIRALRTALLFKLRHEPGTRTLLITSPNPEEGKSTVVLNLAIAFQQNHLKVALIDADLRKPKLHKLLKTGNSVGLTQVLEGEVSLDTAMVRNANDLGIDFLPCGSFSNHPMEILGSQAMADVLSRLRLTYDVILIDSPPYLAVADVAVLSEYAQALLVIAKYHKTDKRHLKNLKRRFSEPAIKVLGVVINQVGVKEKDYYYHQYYYYGYGDAAKKK